MKTRQLFMNREITRSPLTSIQPCDTFTFDLSSAYVRELLLYAHVPLLFTPLYLLVFLLGLVSHRGVFYYSLFT